jgi:hypothetical protein
MRFITNMHSTTFTRTQFLVTDIQESDDTLQAVTSTAECTTPTDVLEAEIDNDNENDRYDDLPG